MFQEAKSNYSLITSAKKKQTTLSYLCVIPIHQKNVAKNVDVTSC